MPQLQQQNPKEEQMVVLPVPKARRPEQANIAQWCIRQRFRYSIGMSWLPNSIEVAMTTVAALTVSWGAGAAVYMGLALMAWVIGRFMQYKGYFEYEQRYISELNPVLMEIRRKR